jgi:hypothetical protein
MKKSQLLIGAVISGLVAGSAVRLSTANADHHDKAKAEGKEHACKGKDHACKGKAKKGKKAETKAEPQATTTPADAPAPTEAPKQ